jgi:hypothetical protein
MIRKVKWQDYDAIQTVNQVQRAGMSQFGGLIFFVRCIGTCITTCATNYVGRGSITFTVHYYCMGGIPNAFLVFNQ